MINTVGHLNVVEILGNSLRIHGWAASPDREPPKEFLVYSGGNIFSGIEYALGLDSPDVEKVHPRLVGAGHCRFMLRIPLSANDADQLRRSVIRVIPNFGGLRGRTLFGRTKDSEFPLPPEEYVKLVGGDMGSGLEFFDYFIDYCGLRSSDSVLDIGCGFGRMAMPLTSYISKDGCYEGFDISAKSIDWAKANLTSLYPRFNFQKVDLFNKCYNPAGKIKSEDFEFPYQNANFDFVFLTSVFTHMYPKDVKHYLSEIFRVLKSGGKCLLTCFLLNIESEQLMNAGNSTLNFCFPLEDCFTIDPNSPENAIAFDETMFLKWISGQGFTLKSKHYGSWCGRIQFASYQDMLILEKT